MKFLKTLAEHFAGKPIDWDELEESLIRADLGVAMTTRIIKTLQEREAWSVMGINDVVKVVRQEIARVLPTNTAAIKPLAGKPNVVLLLGVNGTGKTTSTAKLTRYLQKDGHSVLLAAADTFRAAAIEQLDIWGQRVGVDVVKHRPGADPSAVVFDGMQAAKSRGIDVLLIDTAGRLHTKLHLIEELKKIRRVIAREQPDAPHETLLVLDAITGQNGLQQARVFKEATDITGIVLTKLDGTAKGGVIISIQEELGVPVKYIGVGEEIEDLQPFEPADFVQALLGQ